MDRARRRRTYFWLMGTCLVLIALAWNVVRLWSTTAAVVMSAVAALLAPVAAVVGNRGVLDATAPPTPDDPRTRGLEDR